MFCVLVEELIHSKHKWLYVLSFLVPNFYKKSRIFGDFVSSKRVIVESFQVPHKIPINFFGFIFRILQIVVDSPFLGPAESPRPLHSKLKYQIQ